MDRVRSIDISWIDGNFWLVELVPFILLNLFKSISEFWFSDKNAVNQVLYSLGKITSKLIICRKNFLIK